MQATTTTDSASVSSGHQCSDSGSVSPARSVIGTHTDSVHMKEVERSDHQGAGASATWLTREELASLAGPLPTDAHWAGKMRRGYAQWCVLRDDLAQFPLERAQVKGEIGRAIGHHPWVWKVRGITRKALDALGGSDRMFNHWERGGFQRAHLHTWDGLLEELATIPRSTGFDEWCRLVWDLDVTVICRDAIENHMLDTTRRSEVACAAFFRDDVITFANPSNLFPDGGSSFKYRRAEQGLLRLL